MFMDMLHGSKFVHVNDFSMTFTNFGHKWFMNRSRPTLPQFLLVSVQRFMHDHFPLHPLI